MYSYHELCKKEIVLFKKGKFQQDIQDFFYELNVIGYLEEDETSAKNIEPVSESILVIVCDFNEVKYRPIMESLGLIYMQDYIFGIDLIRLLDDGLMFEYGEKMVGKKVVLWGIGKKAETFLVQNPQLDISYIVDNNVQKWGEYFNGKRICSPEDIRNERKGTFVVICSSMYVLNISEQLDGMGLNLNIDYFFPTYETSLSCLLVQTIMDSPKNILGCVGKNYIQVQVYGDVFLCCAPFLNFPQGNLLYQSFEDIAKSIAMRLYSLSLINKTYSFCSGVCSPLYIYNQEKRKSEGDSVQRDNNSTCIELPGRRYLEACYDDTCNLKCISCRDKKITRHSDADKRCVDVIHREVSRITQKLSSLCVSGYGDPVYSLYYEDLVFNHFDGKYLTYITNGILFNKEYWDKLWQRYKNEDIFIKINVSIDAATEETYRLVRDGNFSVLFNNLRMMSDLRKKNKINELIINFTIHLYNFREILDFIMMGQDLGVDFVVFTRMHKTFHTDEEYKNMDVLDPGHESHDELLNIFENTLFKQDLVWPVFLQAYTKN